MSTKPSCRCGTKRTDQHACPELEYTTMGAIYLLWGGTSVPSRVSFRCVKCGEVFDQVTERRFCRAYVV
jgi:hypothetical protein